MISCSSRSAFQVVGVGSQVQTAGSGDEAIAYLSGEGKFSDRGVYPTDGRTGRGRSEAERGSRFWLETGKGLIDDRKFSGAFLSAIHDFGFGLQPIRELPILRMSFALPDGIRPVHDYFMRCAVG